MTNYPAQIDTSTSLPSVVDNTTPVSGLTVNRLRDAIIAVETELGVKPSGTFTTVRQRLDTIEQLFTLDVVEIAGDIGGTSASPKVIGLQTRPISPNAPSTGQVLGWNGVAWAPVSAVQLAQDIGNTTLSPFVVGLQGRPVVNTLPQTNQVLGWTGANWAPITVNVSLSLLPTVNILPVDLTFVGGDGYSGLSTPFRIGSRGVDMSGYPGTSADGRTRLMTFKADLEVTNPLTTGTVQLKDVTSNAIVTGPTSNINAATNANPIQVTTITPHTLVTGQSAIITSVTGNTAANGTWTVSVIDGYNFTLNTSIGNSGYTGGGTVQPLAILSTSSVVSGELTATLLSGNFAGSMRTDQISMYEVQVFLTNGGITDQVICRNARISMVYGPAVLATNLLALALPTEVQFVAGTALTGFATPAGMGGRNFDITNFPPLLSDNSGRARNVEFFADLEVSAPGIDGYCQLYDTTHNVVITNSLIHFTNTTGAETHSVPLIVGTSSGNIRSDAPARYEVQLWKISGSPADRAICNNARLIITYS